ncbi:MAG: ABC transporter permease [Saprospiraceae bacterium]|nr:ABC transporter permease [Saprospiraceae bacterium]
MVQYYLKRALRGLRKQPVISAINILGLSLGLACFMLFLLHVVDEFSFDRFHHKADRLFRVYNHTAAGFRNEPEHKDPWLPMPLGPAMQRDMPEVVAFTRMRGWGLFIQAPKGIFEESTHFVDPAFLHMFSFPMLFGDPLQALNDPFQVVLTENLALKLFGERNPVGRTLELKVFDQFEPYTVSGVLANPPSNNSLELGILLPFARYAASERGKQESDRWTRCSMETFVELTPGSTLSSNQPRLQQFYTQYHPTAESNARSKGWWTKAESPFGYGLQPIRTMHNDISVEGQTVNPAYPLILLGIGSLILLIACINFTTLAIGRAAGRAREIGVTKVLGASRQQLTLQYLGESLLLSGLSTILGIILAIATLPLFNQLTDKNLVFSVAQFPEMYILLPLLMVLVGLLAGIYPAIVLARLQPIKTIRSTFRMGGENWFTRSLLTGQFALSTGLLICTVIMLRQLDFLQTQNPGFNKENVVVINAFGVNDLTRTLQQFREKLSVTPEITHISGVEIGFGANAGWSTSGFDFYGKPIQIFEYVVDQEYIPTLELEILTGRNFDAQVVADTQVSVIINETAMQLFGWSLQNAVGQVLDGYNTENPARNPVVIGVVKDYHFSSFRKGIEPMMLQMFSPFPRSNFFVRMQAGDTKPHLAQLSEAWTAIEPTIPFRYAFLDEELNTFYKTEQRWSTVVSLAGGLCLFLACLGLFGLAALVTANRVKEIGIRKVLGASVWSITGQLARDFLRLVLLAVLIAVPLGWYCMQRWLGGFESRIELAWWMFALAGLIALGVALFTVSIQSVKAAMANPVHSLKNE